MIQHDDIRTFLRDRPEYNRLLDKEEFTDKQIDQAMKLTVMLFNEIPPKTTYVLSNFPHQYLLFLGTCWHLLFGGGIGRSRNRLQHTTNGVAIDDEAHADVELSLSQGMKSEFMQMAQNTKIEANVKNGWSNVSSEYMSPGYNKDLWIR